MVRKPVDQKPISVTSPRPKEVSTPNITENKYISIIPIMKVGKETPAREITSITFDKKVSLFIPVYTPKITPEIIAKSAETNTNSKVAGILSAIKTDTGLLSW